jgi:arylsulfatase
MYHEATYRKRPTFRLSWSRSIIFTVAILTSLFGCVASKEAIASGIAEDAPNILLIVADDMGYTDLGAFGGEIATPNLDRLAFDGIRLTNLHAAPTCSPTRAMLLSGVDHHLAGMGTMTEDIVANQVGKPGYERYLNDRVLPLPELLRKYGYHTYISGKWHLGSETHALPFHSGFEKSFALLHGGASHLNDLPMVGPGVAQYTENGKPISIPENFYSTQHYADRMIAFIQSKPDDGRPFFGYLAFTAPHWPLQAPPASIREQNGNYKGGYQELYGKRLERLVQLGLISNEVARSAQKTFANGWSSLSDEERRFEQRRMEIYAAMIADMDLYVGKVLAAIEHAGMEKNTVVIFLSDNGPEGNNIEIGWEQLTRWINVCCDNSYENMGAGNSYLWLGANWGKAVAGPVGRYKGWTHQGGVRVPGIVYLPKAKSRGRIDDTLLSVVDVYPTVLDLAGIQYPVSMDENRTPAKLQGISWAHLLRGDRNTAKTINERVLAWELFGKRAVRKGNWKLISYPPPHGNTKWQLYNVHRDPTESFDIASDYPQKVLELSSLWDNYARQNGVVMPDRPLLY